jgi:hypothetical protein
MKRSILALGNYRAGEYPACGHHNAPHIVSDDDTDSDPKTGFNPALFDEPHDGHNYFHDDDDDHQPNGNAIMVIFDYYVMLYAF